MEIREVYCEACNREIKHREEAVITSVFFSLVCYHDSCFSKSLKGWNTLFVSNSPINGTWGTFSAIASFIAALIFLIFNPLGSYSLIGIVLFVLPIYRILAWFMYERYLEA